MLVEREKLDETNHDVDNQLTSVTPLRLRDGVTVTIRIINDRIYRSSSSFPSTINPLCSSVIPPFKQQSLYFYYHPMYNSKPILPLLDSAPVWTSASSSLTTDFMVCLQLVTFFAYSCSLLHICSLYNVSDHLYIS